MLASGSVASTAGASVSASRRGADSSVAGAALDSSSFQDKSVDFLHKYTMGCQPSTTTNLYVLLGKDLHLQDQPDYCHGWGA
jgi:hypothetical protein